MKLKLLLSLFFSISLLHSEIIEISQMKEILPHVDQDTLVVFDIDDTLMVPNQMLGGDCWFRHELKLETEKGFSFEESLAKILPQYMLFQHKTGVKLVEPDIPAIIHHLQSQGIKVMGLTTRSTELAYRTIQQLKTLQIDLGKNAPEGELSGLKTHYPLYYIEGILFTQVRHKGKVLKELCEYLGYAPKKIIFINDKEKYVLQLEEVFPEIGIPYIGFRYAACDDDYANYDTRIAAVQRKYFNQILSDEDAATILKVKGDEL